ncbi:MAG: hypothetical protein AAFS10_11935 [Myxococcota bacterium]
METAHREEPNPNTATPSPSAPVPYHETLTTPPMMAVTLLTSTMAVATLMLMVRASERWPVTVAFGLFVLLLVGALVAFNRLQLSVAPKGVEVSFSGLLTRRVDYSVITEVEVRDYDWQEFFGWGLRWSLTDNHAVAYSLLGIEGSIRLTLADGATVVISCRRPQQALSAIEAYRNRLLE